MLKLPLCRWRGNPTIAGHHWCSSPKLRHPPQGVRDELCAGCYLRDHEPSTDPPIPPGTTGAEKIKGCKHRSPRPLRDERGKVRLVAY